MNAEQRSETCHMKYSISRPLNRNLITFRNSSLSLPLCHFTSRPPPSSQDRLQIIGRCPQKFTKDYNDTEKETAFSNARNSAN